MLYYNKIDVSVSKTRASRKYIICHYSFFWTTTLGLKATTVAAAMIFAYLY